MKHPRLPHALALAVSIALLLLATFYITARPSFAQSDAPMLTGRVISEVDGSPVPGVQIQFIDPYFPGLFDAAVTDSTGHYTVTNSFLEQFDLTTATFKVYFKSGGTHLSEYYDDTDDLAAASLVTLTTHAAISGIDASLALGGHISGQVLAADTHQPLTRTVLALYTPTGESVPTHSFILADNSGNYHVTGIVSGTYKLGVQVLDSDSYYVGSYYPNTQWIPEAQTIQVATGVHISNVNFSLIRGGHITGTVTSSNSRAWIEPLVEVYDQEGRLLPSEIRLSQLDQRNYTVSNLLPGDYRLHIRDEDETHWPEYYDNQSTLALASTVSVTPGQVTGNVNAELALIPRLVDIATSSALPHTILLTLGFNPVPIYTTNSGQSWQQVPAAPWHTESSVAPPNIALAPRTEPGSPARMLAAPYDSLYGLYRSGDNGESWAQQPFPFESCTGTVRFTGPVASPVAPSRLYLGHTCIIHIVFGGSISTSRLLVSRDNGVSWQESVSLGTPHDSYIQNLIPSPVLADRVYAHGAYPQVDDANWLQSDDGGNNWSAREFPIIELVLDAQDAARLYGLSRIDYTPLLPRYGKRSEDGGEQWTNWAQQPCNLGQAGTEDNVLQLMAHPTQAGVLFLRCAQGLYRSDDGGDSWTELASVPGQLLAPDYGIPGRIFWGKNDGLWASRDNGNSWQPIMPNYALSTAAGAQVPLFLPSLNK